MEKICNILIYIIKSLKTLALETLTTKCKKDTYEELIDFDLMEKCFDGQLSQSCAKSSEFICNCGLGANIQDMKR